MRRLHVSLASPHVATAPSVPMDLVELLAAEKPLYTFDLRRIRHTGVHPDDPSSLSTICYSIMDAE